MKVCAHINYGPFNHGHKRFGSVSAAVRYFTSEVAGTDYGTGTDEQCLDVFPQCEDCTSGMCFHDYPMARYELGPRGGVRKAAI